MQELQEKKIVQQLNSEISSSQSKTNEAEFARLLEIETGWLFLKKTYVERAKGWLKKRSEKAISQEVESYWKRGGFIRFLYWAFYDRDIERKSNWLAHQEVNQAITHLKSLLSSEQKQQSAATDILSASQTYLNQIITYQTDRLSKLFLQPIQKLKTFFAHLSSQLKLWIENANQEQNNPELKQSTSEPEFKDEETAALDSQGLQQAPTEQIVTAKSEVPAEETKSEETLTKNSEAALQETKQTSAILEQQTNPTIEEAKQDAVVTEQHPISDVPVEEVKQTSVETEQVPAKLESTPVIPIAVEKQEIKELKLAEQTAPVSTKDCNDDKSAQGSNENKNSSDAKDSSPQITLEIKKSKIEQLVLQSEKGTEEQIASSNIALAKARQTCAEFDKALAESNQQAAEIKEQISKKNQILSKAVEESANASDDSLSNSDYLSKESKQQSKVPPRFFAKRESKRDIADPKHFDQSTASLPDSQILPNKTALELNEPSTQWQGSIFAP